MQALIFLTSFHCHFCLLSSPSQQIFVIVVWNFELYMIPLALLLPLAWNYILIASGKDTRQDVVSNLNHSSCSSAFLSSHHKRLFHTMQGKISALVIF